MLRTIKLGSCILVQGEFVRDGANGWLVIRVGGRLFEGPAVPRRGLTRARTATA
ncbi:MAG: hypothetical protein AAGE18_16720 [Pseudomonadota bacterium]